MESIWESLWAGSITIITLLLALPFFNTHLPALLDNQIVVLASNLWRLILYPYVEITFAEYTGNYLKRSEIYAAIEAYLGEICPDRAARLKAAPRNNGGSIVLSMDDGEEVAVQHDGVRFWWSCNKIVPLSTSIYFHDTPEDRRFYRLRFHRRHRCCRDSYIEFVFQRGKDIEVMQRQRKLYTNKVDPSTYHNSTSLWNHLPFKHPATFKTLAMDDEKKREIMEDLVLFSQGKDYYSSVGKPWKRGYLLYGPPGTGKSTMIAAMSNFLKYDVYDLELTAVNDNTTLRQLLIETKGKSIIMIEDIDCSLDLWERRKKQAAQACSASDEEKKAKAVIKGEDNKEESKVTLSGLLNFIDGLWSSCDGGERIIVFTTNHREKLDPALLRRGRMDVHVEMPYCSFEGFKTLAKNYLGIEEHSSFDRIRKLLEDNNISPADVAESLMPKPANSPFFDGIRNRLEEGAISLGAESADPEISLMPKSGSDIKDEELIKGRLHCLIETIEGKSRANRGMYSVHTGCSHAGSIAGTEFDVPAPVHPMCSGPCNSRAAWLPSGPDELLACQPTRHERFGSSLHKDSSARALNKFSRQKQPFFLKSKQLVNGSINHQPVASNTRQVGTVTVQSSSLLILNYS